MCLQPATTSHPAERAGVKGLTGRDTRNPGGPPETTAHRPP